MPAYEMFDLDVFRSSIITFSLQCGKNSQVKLKLKAQNPSFLLLRQE
jgi:hypothetical protein